MFQILSVSFLLSSEENVLWRTEFLSTIWITERESEDKVTNVCRITGRTAEQEIGYIFVPTSYAGGIAQHYMYARNMDNGLASVKLMFHDLCRYKCCDTANGVSRTHGSRYACVLHSLSFT